VFHVSSTLYYIFILCIIVTNLALWLQDLNKLTYLLTYLLNSALLWRQETETLQLQPTELCFLLDDLVRKLEHTLLATATKRRCFLKVQRLMDQICPPVNFSV